MGNTELGFAGTLDRYGAIDGALTLLDIKTGQLHNAALSAQLTGYGNLLYAERGIVPDQTLALKLSKDGTYELRPVLPDAELLRACLFIHQAVTKTVTKKGKMK